MREEIKRSIVEAVDKKAKELIQLSIQIHSNPEIGWEEQRASQLLCDLLEENDFTIEKGLCGLSTAFRASYGKGRPAVAFIAEYDALPDIGHGCGHNIIAGAAVGAGTAVRSVIDSCGGSAIVMGCPGEEKLGGKAIMVNKGAFDGIDAALMVHPVAGGENWEGFRSAASISIEVDFRGKESHAAANPWNGINALEGLILAFNNINALRLHLRDRERINGVILEGGKCSNIIPEHARALFSIRAPDDAYLEQLKGKVINCFEGAARALEAKVEYRWGLRCAAMESSPILLDLWRKNMRILGLDVGEIVEVSASTDMGNVSRILPSIHPFLSICSKHIPFHSYEFAKAAGSEEAQKAVLDGAKALAMTASDLFYDSGLLSRAKKN